MSKHFKEDDEAAKAKSEANEFAKMFEGSLSQIGKKLTAGDKIKAEVLSVGKEEIFVSTGTIDDGILLKTDLGDHPVPAKGDVLNLYVTSVKGGQIHVSTKATSKNLADDLEDAFDMMLPVEGKVTEVCNGGFRVLIFGKTAFCPISQMDSRRIDDANAYIGKKFEFMITKFAEKGRNIVVSRRQLLADEQELSVQAFREETKVGAILPGKVTRIEKYGAFVEVAPQIEGLVHISEVSWARIEDAAEVLKVGQATQVKIIKIEELDGRLKISLSIKQAESTPWENLPAQCKVGLVIEGRVTKCMKFGAFVQVVPGIEGLVPLGEMSSTQRVTRSDEIFKEGDRIQVLIKDINMTEKRILLSHKDAVGKPNEEQVDLAQYSAKASMGTFGGAFGDRLKLVPQGNNVPKGTSRGNRR